MNKTTQKFKLYPSTVRQCLRGLANWLKTRLSRRRSRLFWGGPLAPNEARTRSLQTAVVRALADRHHEDAVGLCKCATCLAINTLVEYGYYGGLHAGVAHGATQAPEPRRTAAGQTDARRGERLPKEKVEQIRVSFTYYGDPSHEDAVAVCESHEVLRHDRDQLVKALQQVQIQDTLRDAAKLAEEALAAYEGHKP